MGRLYPKMAPVCVADRPVFLQFLVCLLFFIIGTKQIESLLVYDRQSLLFIRPNVSDLSTFDHGGQYTSRRFWRESRLTCTGPRPYLPGASVPVAAVDAAVGW